MAERRTLTPPYLLVGGTIALLLVRLALSTLRSGPVVVADEIGYLMNARVLAGGPHGQLALAPFYHGGYSLLLAPILAVTSDPGTAYHLVLGLNALLAAAVFPLLYVLLRDCGFKARLALGAAFAGALYPSVTILSQVALSENALFPLTCIWLIAATRLLAAQERPRGILWAAISGGSAAALYAVHGRMVVTVVLTGALLLWRMIRTRLAARDAVLGVVVLGAGLLGAHFLSASLIAANYGGHATNEATTRLSGLEHPHALLEFLENLAGQTWSLIVATFGLAGVAVAATLRRGTRRERALAPAVLLLAALTAGLLLVSAGSFPQRTRADMLVYGRYVELVAPALIAFGLAIIGRERTWSRPQAGLLALALLTGIVVLTSATSHGLTGANRWNVASLPFRTGDLGPATLLGAALVAVAGAALLGSSARRYAQVAWIVCGLLFAATTAYSLHAPVLEAQDAVYPHGWTSPTTAAEQFHVRAVAYDLDRTSGRAGYPTVGGLYVVQWFLPGSRLLLFHGGRASPPSRFVLTQRRRQAGQIIWTAVGTDEVLARLSR